jgi:hypothetical protein
MTEATTQEFHRRRKAATQNGATAVYAYLRQGSNLPYYVGVSTGMSRVIDQRGHRKHGISVPKDRSRIVFLRGPLTKAAAAEWEKFYISRFGRKDLGTGCLHNCSAGGEGLQEPSPETRRKISAASKGRKPSPVAVAHIRAFGMLPKSDEHKRKIALAQKGRQLSPEHAANVAASKARAVAQRAASLGLTLEEYRQQIADRANEGRARYKRQLQDAANSLGMSVRSYRQWLADGQPSDYIPYRKAGVPPIPGHEDLTNQAKRKAERGFVGLSERQYRLWVKDGRPSNVDHYRTIYGKPGRRPKSALELNAA